MESYWNNFRENYEFESLKNDIETDICIIGAGITGLTAAYYLSKKGKDIVLLEKDKVCSHTSCGTTGKITSQHGLFYDYLIQSENKELAKLYYEANEEAIKNIEKIIKTEKIDCDFRKVSAYVFTQNKDDVEKIEKEVKSTNKIGINSKFVNNIDIPIDILGGIEFKDQAQFHPIKYANGLESLILKYSGNIYENTKVVDIEKDDDKYLVKTENNIVKANKVIIATRYPFLIAPGHYFTKMYQSTSFAVLVDPHEKIPIEGVYINTEQPQLSFRIIEENDKTLLLAVGYDYKTGGEIVGNPYEYLKKKIDIMYPKSEVLNTWCAEDCISLDKIPYIGEYSKDMPNVYVATGFNKWGMTSSNIAANIIVDKILGEENKYDKIFRSDRLDVIKNRDEMKNMLKETVNSFVGKRLKGEKCPTCTHLGCKTIWNDIEKTWDCPCHGSRFGKRGNLIEGPAIENLNDE